MTDTNPAAGGLTEAERLIAAERRRQIEAEGWTAEHDADHGSKLLRDAAWCYEKHPGDEAWVPSMWPWDESWWKPKDHLSNLIRAGALFQAALDVGDAPHLDHLHRDAIARCARKIAGIAAARTEAADREVARVTAAVEALCEEWESWADGRSTPRIDAFRDAAHALRAALSSAGTDALDDLLGRERAKAWDEGMRTGTSRAMRKMSDEPNLPLASDVDNPYRAAAVSPEGGDV